MKTKTIRIIEKGDLFTPGLLGGFNGFVFTDKVKLSNYTLDIYLERTKDNKITYEIKACDNDFEECEFQITKEAQEELDYEISIMQETLNKQIKSLKSR